MIYIDEKMRACEACYFDELSEFFYKGFVKDNENVKAYETKKNAVKIFERLKANMAKAEGLGKPEVAQLIIDALALGFASDVELEDIEQRDRQTCK